MAEHKESHDHRHADAAKHSANGTNGEQAHPKGVHGGLNEDIMGVIDINTLIKSSSSIINSKDSEIPQVISELKKLGELADKKAVLELDKFLEWQEKNHEGRKTSAIPHALIALGKTEDKSMSTRIVRWMHDKHPDVRAAVADAVCYLGDTEDNQCSKAVAEMLKDHEDRVRLAAVRALGRIGDDSVILSVCALAADPSSEVRAESTKSVVAILKKDLRGDVSKERLQRILLVAKTVRESFIKLERGEKISLVRDSFDSCINDITTILISHQVKNAKDAVEMAQREIERLMKENKQKLDNADNKIGDMAAENDRLESEVKSLKKKLEETVLGRGDLTSKFIDLKARVEKAEKLAAESEALRDEVETLKEQLSSEEGRRKSFGGTEKDLQRQILTYKKEGEEAAKLIELYKKQITELQSVLQATFTKAGAEIKKGKDALEEVESIGKEQSIEDQVASLKIQLDEKAEITKEVDEKSKQIEALETRLKDSDDKINELERKLKASEDRNKSLESRMNEKDLAGLNSITSAIEGIEKDHKTSIKRKLGYKIGVGFLTAVVLIESGLLVRNKMMIDQSARMAKISSTSVETAKSKAQNATQRLSRTEAAYKEISSMDFVIGKFFTDPEAIISLHYKTKNKAEARQILGECRDKYWEISDSIKDMGPEKACEEMRKYYTLVDLVGSGKLKNAKEKYKEVFGKEFKLLVF